LRRIRVADVMSAQGAARAADGVPTVRASDDLRRVASLFLEHGTDTLDCVDADGRVIGCITRAAVASRLATAGTQETS
jgi:CBS domain-containing protein